MSQGDPHASQYPYGVQVDEDLKALIYRYYVEVDIHGHHDEWAQCFAEDAQLGMPDGSSLHGRDAIRTCHVDMWETVKERLHWPQKLFSLGQRSLEYVVIGKVEYWDKDRAYSSCNMAAHFQCQRNAGSGAVEITWGRIWVS